MCSEAAVTGMLAQVPSLYTITSQESHLVRRAAVSLSVLSSGRHTPQHTMMPKETAHAMYKLTTTDNTAGITQVQ